MTGSDLNATGPERKGAIFRLFGVVLMSLGGLNSMLFWRGGFDHGLFPLTLLGAGIFLYAVGAIRRRPPLEGVPNDL